MNGNKWREGYGWAMIAGLNAGLAAVSAKLVFNQMIKYGLIIFFNATMWICYVNSLRALSSLQATVTNFAANFLSSGLAGYFLFEESLSIKWLVGAVSIIVGVLVVSKSTVEIKSHRD